MKKYFYFVVEYQPGDKFRIKDAIDGVCESSTVCFPLIEVINEVTLRLKNTEHRVLGHIDNPINLKVIHSVEISKDDYLMMNYESIHGKDAEK